MSFDLRPYQQTVIQQLRREVARGHKRILLVAPTGSGKTIVASEIIRSAVEKNNRALFLAHRRELIFQCREKLFEYRVPHGLILAGEDYGAGQPVQVASIQTLHSRTKRQVMDPPPADLVVVDECHRARAWTYADLLNDYPDAIILGLTATPCRGDGRGLGRLFDAMVECPAVAELIEQQFLVPTRVFSPSIPGLEGVRVRKGDYLEGELAEVMDLPKLVGDVVTHWHRLGENRKTVVFATGVEHSIHIRDEFRRSGVWCEHIDGTTPKEERREILERLSEGKVQIVANCMVLTEGWDQPDVACVILARPTKHMGLYRQMVGRVLRPAEGKTDALVLDHAGATLEHGFVEDPVLWTLDEDARAENPIQDARKRRRAPVMIICPECKAIFSDRAECPSCGHRFVRKGQAVDVVDGQLGELNRDKSIRYEPDSQSTKRRWWRMLKWVQAHRGYQPGWVAHKYRARFGVWPKGMYGDPMEPDREAMAFIRHLQIKHAKRRSR